MIKTKKISFAEIYESFFRFILILNSKKEITNHKVVNDLSGSEVVRDIKVQKAITLKSSTSYLSRKTDNSHYEKLVENIPIIEEIYNSLKELLSNTKNKEINEENYEFNRELNYLNNNIEQLHKKIFGKTLKKNIYDTRPLVSTTDAGIVSKKIDFFERNPLIGGEYHKDMKLMIGGRSRKIYKDPNNNNNYYYKMSNEKHSANYLFKKDGQLKKSFLNLEK